MGVLFGLKNILKRMIGEMPTSVLVKRGLKVGKNFDRQQGSYIDPTHCFLIQIGENVTLSIRVTIMAHDASTKQIIGFTRIGEVVIGDHVFIGANSTILPGVHIGNHCVIGANSVVTKDIPDNSVAVGNPARVICNIEDFAFKNMQLLENRKKFGQEYRFSRNLTNEMKDEMKQAVREGISFIE